jgi:D-alanine-D-alanine ligase
MKKLRVLALMHEALVPPRDARGMDLSAVEWKTEYDVVQTLRKLGHDVLPVGVAGDLAPIRDAVREFKPQIAFNLLEAFDDVVTWDQNVVAYLELMKVPYTGCNSRGLMLGRDKAITKKLLAYHRIAVPEFAIVPRGGKVRRPRRLGFPLIVKSLTFDASIGISQASVVDNDEKLADRVRFVHESLGTDAIVEAYIEGRELYVGVLGNSRLTALPVWELSFANMPEESRHIATERLKWSDSYRRKHGIDTGEAKALPAGLAEKIQTICKRTYRTLLLSGYARIDLRLADTGRVYVLEANPNPQLASGEDFANSAQRAGIAYTQLLQRILMLGLQWETKAAAERGSEAS